jgi:hypothetical protein
MTSTYTHPSVVRGDVVEVPLYFILLLAQIIERKYCLLKAIMAGGERQVKNVRDEIGRLGT